MEVDLPPGYPGDGQEMGRKILGLRKLIGSRNNGRVVIGLEVGMTELSRDHFDF